MFGSAGTRGARAASRAAARGRRRGRPGVLAAAAAWCALAPALAAGDGLFVWEPAVRMTDGRHGPEGGDAVAQRRLLDFCRAPGVDVRRLYFLADPDRWDPDSLRSLLRAAAARGIAVYALPRGTLQDDWARPFPWGRQCDHGAVIAWVDAVARFNAKSHDREGRFSGIQLDIEPHRARAAGRIGRKRPVWRGDSRGLRRGGPNAALAREFLELLDRVRERAAPHGLQLAVTLPTWYDRDAPGESYRLRYGGARRLLAHHVMDRADFVTLMNYVDGSTRARRAAAVRAIRDELRHGPVESLFETARPGARGRAPRREQTLFEEGERGYRELRELLRRRFAGQPNFIGCGVHHYLDSYGSGRRGWPDHSRAAPPSRERSRRSGAPATPPGDVAGRARARGAR